MSLCRHYVRELRRSVLVETPEHEKTPGSIRSSAALERMGDIDDPAGPSMYFSGSDKTPDQRVSAFLRQENGQHNGRNGNGNGRNGSPPHRGSLSSEKMRGGVDEAATHERRPRLSTTLTTPDGRNNSGSPAHTVARRDIRVSAEKILYTFLLPGSEREIVLPDSITARVTSQIEEEGRDDPEVFDAAKDYVFQAMERDAFPGFLRAKALSNLVPPSIMLRLIFGLLSMFGGWWTAFVLIFLDYSRPTRLWVSHLPGSVSFLPDNLLLAPVILFLLPILSFSSNDFPCLSSYPKPKNTHKRLVVPRTDTNSRESSSSPSRSASTRSRRSNTRSIRSWPLPASASTRSCPLPASASPTSGISSTSAPSWCSASPCSPLRPWSCSLCSCPADAYSRCMVFINKAPGHGFRYPSKWAFHAWHSF